MKVFALLCATAVAISSSLVEAADVAVACDADACTKNAAYSIDQGSKAVYTPKACTTGTEKPYIKEINIVGAGSDVLTYAIKNDATSVTGTNCADATGVSTIDVGGTTALLCGYGSGVTTTLEVTCKTAAAASKCQISSDAVTFECAAPTEDKAVTCTADACTGTANLKIPYGKKAVFTPKDCTDTTKVPFLKSISITGAGTDKLTYKSKNGATDVSGTDCSTTTAAATLTAGDSTALTCGSGAATTVEVTCTTDTPGTECTLASSTVTFDCAAATGGAAGADVTPTCETNACTTTTDYKIPFGKKATFTPPACGTSGQFPYLKSIAVTGASGDKLTYKTYSGTTASTTTGCFTASGAADSNAISSTTECGKGDGTVTKVEVMCGNADKDCVLASGAVTFECNAPTPAPSTGSMLTKANAIVGVVSGMVGALVYFNRG